ncbi:MAG: ankyrin repeat domain-containing protein [Burkholderiaceae bacterium]|nr:ankyrin repeat domain-containing protein [Burkholderiaceae bacterium]MCD8516308.1 ankyrin repeat domain-containing protein [Burkholderiaceae bacterium]MCD8537141.1 ankyrin repeat domain-containing protein [Burkholderiaceae bacterium]MCD8566288.1 ankyrin repeat domain-containing protein [Burkholderiaceae bacterium]
MQEKAYKSSSNVLFLNILFAFLALIFLSMPVLAQSRDDLWIYVRNDRADDVKALLAQGLDPNTRDKRGNPIIMQAVRDDSWDVFEVVLNNRKTDINIMNGYQETPLMYVSLVGNLEMVKKLVAMGAQVNHLGWTPLHYAASKGQLPVVEFLLAQGALPNAPAPNGTNPIAMAAQAGAFDTVQVLLAAGADPSAININGIDAAQAARDRGHTKLADDLQKVIDERRAQNR